MKRASWLAALAVAIGVVTSGVTRAGVDIDLIEGVEDPLTILPAALLGPASGITIVGGSVVFRGNVGDGVTDNTATSGTYSDFNLISADGIRPDITNVNGIVLTSGTANIPLSNTDASFDPFSSFDDGDTDLEQILTDAGAPSSIVRDVNTLEFEFTVGAGITSVEAFFVFGSDEFPDQTVTDVFAFIVDGVNYAFFEDGSLVSFVSGVNAGNFNDNGDDNYSFEYDGISNSLRVVGLLDDMLMTHSLKISIADTLDRVFDSGVFIGGLIASTEDDGGVTPTPPVIPEPANMLTWSLLGLAGMIAYRRRRLL